MANPVLWIRNNSGAVVAIDDLGLELTAGTPSSEERNLTDEFGYSRLADSRDLKTLVDGAGFSNVQFSLLGGGSWSNLTQAQVQEILSTFTQSDHKGVTDGNPHGVDMNDFAANDVVSRINAATSQIDDERVDLGTHNASGDHDGRYYTETELDAFFEGESSGKKQVDWDRITNKPTNNTAGQYAPVSYRVLETEASSPPSEPGDAAANNAYWYVDDSQHLWKTVGSGWADQGAISTGFRVVDLNDADESILEWNGASWDDTDPVEGYEVTVRDNGDGKQAGYVYNGATKTPSNSWVFRFDVDVDGTKSLDEAYEDGATVNIDNTNGPVKLDGTAASSAPIELTQQSAAPSSNLAAGQLTYIGGKLYAYDGTRSKWLSVERVAVTFGFNGNNLGRTVLDYLGSIPGKKGGFRLPQNATLVGITADSTNAQTAQYQTDVKGGSTWTTRLTVTAAVGGHDMTLDIDFTAGQVPIVRANPTSGNIDYPTCTIIFAYRP